MYLKDRRGSQRVWLGKWVKKLVPSHSSPEDKAIKCEHERWKNFYDWLNLLSKWDPSLISSLDNSHETICQQVKRETA